jgi:hypothetical protein
VVREGDGDALADFAIAMGKHLKKGKTWVGEARTRFHVTLSLLILLVLELVAVILFGHSGIYVDKGRQTVPERDRKRQRRRGRHSQNPTSQQSRMKPVLEAVGKALADLADLLFNGMDRINLLKMCWPSEDALSDLFLEVRVAILTAACHLYLRYVTKFDDYPYTWCNQFSWSTGHFHNAAVIETFLQERSCCLDPGFCEPMQRNAKQLSLQEASAHVEQVFAEWDAANRVTTLKEEFNHRMNRYVADGSKSAASGYAKVSAASVCNRLARAYTGLGNRDMQKEPPEILKQNFAEASRAVKHARPNQTGNVKWAWVSGQINTADKTLFAGLDTKGLKQHFEKQWDELEPQQQHDFKMTHVASVVGKRAALETQQAHHREQQQQLEAKPTPWNIGTSQYPMTAESVSSYVDIFRDKTKAIQFMFELGLSGEELESWQAQCPWKPEHAAASAMSSLFEVVVPSGPAEDHSTWSLASKLYSAQGHAQSCKQLHYGYCPQRDAAIAENVEKLSLCLQGFVRQLPTEKRWRTQVLLSATTADDRAVSLFVWVGGGKIRPSQPIFVLQKLVDVAGLQFGEASQHAGMYKALALPQIVRSSVMKLPSHFGGPWVIPEFMTCFELAVKMAGVAHANAWEVHIVTAVLDQGSPDVLTARQIESTKTLMSYSSSRPIQVVIPQAEADEEADAEAMLRPVKRLRTKTDPKTAYAGVKLKTASASKSTGSPGSDENTDEDDDDIAGVAGFNKSLDKALKFNGDSESSDDSDAAKVPDPGKAGQSAPHDIHDDAEKPGLPKRRDALVAKAAATNFELIKETLGDRPNGFSFVAVHILNF